MMKDKQNIAEPTSNSSRQKSGKGRSGRIWARCAMENEWPEKRCEEITDTDHRWRGGPAQASGPVAGLARVQASKELSTNELSPKSGDSGYVDRPGFCKSATLDDIRANDFVLTPGRYVGAAPIEDDGIPFETKLTELTTTLYQQMEDAKKLDKSIRKNSEALGYGK